MCYCGIEFDSLTTTAAVTIGAGIANAHDVVPSVGATAIAGFSDVSTVVSAAPTTDK